MLFELGLSLLVLMVFAHIAVHSALRLSRLSGIGRFAVGFVFIAVMTSLPELSVATMSAIENHSELGFGNLIGANVSNIALIFGVLALLAAFTLPRIHFSQIIRAVALTSLVALFVLFFGGISRSLALILLLVFGLYCGSMLRARYTIEHPPHVGNLIDCGAAAMLTVAAAGIVLLAAHLIIAPATALAAELGITEMAIGAALLGVITNLPDLVISIWALRNGALSLAVGNCLGAIVIKLTLAAGLAAAITPFALDAAARAMLYVFLIVNMAFLMLSYRARFGRFEGIALLILYLLFIVAVIGIEVVI